MLNLKVDVQSAFMERKFTVQKTNRKFLKTGLDHNHEQLNGKTKDVGGAIRLTENDSRLQRWLGLGPETARLIDESEYSIGLYQLKNDAQEHHDSNEASQVKFFNDVLHLKKAFKEFGNPFLDNSSVLISFGTNALSSKEEIKCLLKIKVAGKQQFKEYWNKAVLK